MDVNKFLGIKSGASSTAKTHRDRTPKTVKQYRDEQLYQEQQNPSTSRPYTQMSGRGDSLAQPNFYSGSMRATRTGASAERQRQRERGVAQRFKRQFDREYEVAFGKGHDPNNPPKSRLRSIEHAEKLYQKNLKSSRDRRDKK